MTPTAIELENSAAHWQKMIDQQVEYIKNLPRLRANWVDEAQFNRRLEVRKSAYERLKYFDSMLSCIINTIQ